MNQDYFMIGVVIGVFLLLILIILLVKQNKPDKFRDRRLRRSPAMRRGIGAGLALGMGIGAALGTSMKKPEIGIVFGVAIGIAMGVAFGNSMKKREESRLINRNSRYLYEDSANQKKKLIVGVIAVLAGIIILGILLFFKTK